MNDYLKYLICFILAVVFISPLSCARRVPPKLEKKPPPSILKKPTAKKVKGKKVVKPVEPQIVEEKERMKPEKEFIPELSIILPTYFNEKDSSDLAYIPGGYFVMGDEDGEENERPAAKVFVQSFYIDIYEITNKQYKLFDRKFKNSTSLDCDHCPVTDVTWEKAESYCKWAGKRLPSEAEWEKAAKGTQQFKWPWGNLPLKNRANILGNLESQSNEGYNASPAPVGSFPQGATVFGVFDMAGNVWEWTNSLYLPYKNNVNSDIRYQKQYRVIRGGSWKNIPENARTTFRHPVPPDTKLQNIGFRCAKSAN